MSFLGIRQKVVGSSDEIPTNFFFPTKRYRRTEHLGDEKEKILSELGMVKVFSSNEENESVSTPFCSHKFSKTCWTSHLSNLLEGNNNGEERVLCPNPDCVAPVGPDTVAKLTEPTKDIYMRDYH
ncbi:hypothetical protein DY000_02008140 [Brassica cretica]|uniref:Uncharacterized protein n=1 Tax=Brassica cretica TaxID=69181 RepID=A0ABQ7BS87_BRACR|nr:hypothetical protein DY000_02008140 [Brassica cretica]